jgi:hypothetical protein
MMSPANIWIKTRATDFSTSGTSRLALQSHPLATLKPKAPPSAYSSSQTIAASNGAVIR